ncbi:unnamed protein product [Blepharisma stoltei]|uniref:Phosphoglycerate kinase n=1 Tax=Blepharisma stoltei TaxID=1481888 RepID=A0AAU9JSV2_9CILI|nr:unnamed protein product [Blepharisma stoltei]
MSISVSRLQTPIVVTQGPQLMLSKSHLYMKAYISTTAGDEVSVTNNGTSAVFYEWRKFNRSDFIKAKRSDGINRFYCHYGRDVLLPGETKRFVFTFSSEKPGNFTEEWDLLTDPLLTHPIKQLTLSGEAYENDGYIAQRHFFEEELTRRTVLHTCEEILSDITRSVRTPTPPPPDLEDPKQCQEQFESKNLHYQVWHTTDVIKMLRQLESWVVEHIPLEEHFEPWNLSIDHMKELISLVPKIDLQHRYIERLNFIVKLAKEKPLYRSIYWEDARKVLVDLAEEIPVISSKIRTELDIEDYRFCLPWELTQEEIDKIQKEKTDKEVARAKLVKGKKINVAEEMAKDREACKERLFASVKEKFIDLFVKVLDEEPYMFLWNHMETMHLTNVLPKILQNTNRLNKHMKNSNIANYKIASNSIKTMNEVNMGELSRKYGINEADMEGKKVMLRLNLDVPLSEEIWEEEEVEVQNDPEQDPVTVIEKHCQPREIIDATLLKNAVPTIRYCLDHLAKCVIIVANLGPRVGNNREEYSLLPVAEWLEQELDQHIEFIEEIEIENFDERIEDLPENSVILLENMSFHPAEFGYSIDRDENCYHVDLDKINNFRRKLTSYYELYINDCIGPNTCMETLFKDTCSWRNPGCSSIECPEFEGEAILGLNLEKEIKGISSLFHEPERPLLAIIGGNHSSKINLLDKVVMMYNLLYQVDKIFLGGDMALLFFHVMNSLPSTFDPHLNQFVQRVIDFAKELKKPIILPSDFIICEKINPPEELQLDFTWAHYSDKYQPCKIGEPIPEGWAIVGFHEQTAEKLNSTLFESRRFFWCGSLDLHTSNKEQLNLLNKVAIEFFKSHKESRELHIGIFDVEESFKYLVQENNQNSTERILNSDEEEEEVEEEEEEEKTQEENSEGTVEQNQNSFDHLFNHRFNGGPLTVAILQGRKIRPLELIKEHLPPRPKSAEEDTSYLEII